MTLTAEFGELQNMYSKTWKLLDAPVMLVRHLLSQPTMRATAVFALSGFAFALGTLMLARSMPVEAFGQLSLAIALFNVFGLLAPAGVDQVMLRHHIDPSSRLLALLGASGILLGGIVGAGYSYFNGLPFADGAALAIVIAAGGIVATLVALARSRHLEFPALLLVTAASWILLVIGTLSLLYPMEGTFLPLFLFAAGNVIAAIAGWHSLGKKHQTSELTPAAIPWGEAFSLLGIAAIGTLVLQLERLIIPPIIGISALAQFTVLASVAIFPFRLLTASAGFALVPKLRSSKTLSEKHLLIKREIVSILGLLVAATLGIVLLAPLVTPILTDERYEISFTLALAACFNGYAKVVQSFARALVTACGSPEDIARFNKLGWIGLATSIVGAIAGARWGLTGLLCGVTIGSMVGTIPSILLAKVRLR
jgi:hypothetical protein